MFQCFILHVTTVYFRAVFDPAKNVLQHFCKFFSVKHFKNILEEVTRKIKHQNIFYDIFANVLFYT